MCPAFPSENSNHRTDKEYGETSYSRRDDFALGK